MLVTVWYVCSAAVPVPIHTPPSPPVPLLFPRLLHPPIARIGGVGTYLPAYLLRLPARHIEILGQRTDDAHSCPRPAWAAADCHMPGCRALCPAGEGADYRHHGIRIKTMGQRALCIVSGRPGGRRRWKVTGASGRWARDALHTHLYMYTPIRVRTYTQHTLVSTRGRRPVGWQSRCILD